MQEITTQLLYYSVRTFLSTKFHDKFQYLFFSPQFKKHNYLSFCKFMVYKRKGLVLLFFPQKYKIIKIIVHVVVKPFRYRTSRINSPLSPNPFRYRVQALNKKKNENLNSPQLDIPFTPRFF